MPADPPGAVARTQAAPDKPKPAPPPAPARRDDVMRGIAYMVASCVVWSTLNAGIKWLGATVPVGEMMFFRCAFAMLPTLWLVRRERNPRILRTKRPFAHFARSCYGVLSMGSAFLSYTLMPLADAQAISFTGPLFVTLLSIPLLGERVGLHRWSAVLVGFAGVLMIVAPGGAFGGGGAISHLGAGAALSNAFFFALGAITIRQLSMTEPSVTIVFYHTIFSTLVTALLLPFQWVTPTPLELGVMAAMGLSGGVAQYWSTQSYRFAPASVVGPYSYSSMLWTAAWGYLFFAELPTYWTIGGVVLLIVSGLYILHREIYWQRKRAAEARARVQAAGRIA